jgi:hypothetical protein
MDFILTPKHLGAAVCGVLLAAALHAQKPLNQPVAQVGPAAPLPVYVVNEATPSLPDGFVTGTVWMFSSWTTPSSLSFSARVDATSGGWAYLTLTNDAARKSRWYYVPQMPGAWEKQ